MLEHFDVKSVLLMTNNPAKVSGLSALGVKIVGRLPVIVTPNAHARGYLEAKRLRMAHELPVHDVLARFDAESAVHGEAE
jgi:GTP cyclohydrolase II